MKASTIVLAVAAVGVGLVFANRAQARTLRVAPGGGATPYFPGEGQLPPKLANWSPDLYERLGGLFTMLPRVQPTGRTYRPDSIDRVPVRDVYAAVQPDAPVYIESEDRIDYR